METRTCRTCDTEFRTNNGSKVCYDCHLRRITGGLAPEEGDFNSAHLAAGDWDETQRRQFQRSLRAVELGISEDDPRTNLYQYDYDFDESEGDDPMTDLFDSEEWDDDYNDLFERTVLEEEEWEMGN